VELSRCTVEDPIKLFGCSPADCAAGQFDDPAAAGADEQLQEPPGPAWMTPGESQQQHRNPSRPSWDANGYRTGGKLPSAFPRQRYEPPRPRGSHWSR
jgi:hypothetical protein